MSEIDVTQKICDKHINPYMIILMTHSPNGMLNGKKFGVKERRTAGSHAWFFMAAVSLT